MHQLDVLDLDADRCLHQSCQSLWWILEREERGIFLGGSLRIEVGGDIIDFDSNLTISATDIISESEVHGTIFGSFSSNGGFWECEFKDTPSTVVIAQ